MSGVRWGLGAYAAPFARPLATARGLWASREGLWVVCADDAGHVGLGEAAPLPDWGTESLGEAEDALVGLSRACLTLPEAPCADALAWAGAALKEAGLSFERTPAAFAGAELALLDLAARRAAQPLSRLLSPLPAAEVAVNALLVGNEPAELAASAAAAMADGYRTLKLKVGAGALERDVARVAAVRQAAGEAVALRLDANGGWGFEQAVDALRAFAPFRPEYVEQPVAVGEGAMLAALAEASGVRVAADEAVKDAASVRALLAAGGLAALVLKPLALGGLGATRRLLSLAAAARVEAVLTSVLDRGIGTAGVLHLCAALRSGRAAGLSTSGLFADGGAVEGLTVRCGALGVPQGPGLGVRVRDPGLLALIAEVRHDRASVC